MLIGDSDPIILNMLVTYRSYPSEHKILSRGFENLADLFIERARLYFEQGDELSFHRAMLKSTTLLMMSLMNEQSRIDGLECPSIKKNDDAVISFPLNLSNPYQLRLFNKITEIYTEILAVCGGEGVLTDSLWDTVVKHKSMLIVIRVQAESSAKETDALRCDLAKNLEKDDGELEDFSEASLNFSEIYSSKVFNCYENIALGLHEMISMMLEECLEILPPPNDCIFSVLALGSLARREATPYSDFEWAILFDGADKTQYETHKVYFRRLSVLLWFKVLLLGETTHRMMDISELKWLPESQCPNQKGFSFDGQMASGCHDPLGNAHHTERLIQSALHNTALTTTEREDLIEKIRQHEYEFIGTPQELARYQEDCWGDDTWDNKRGFQTALSSVTCILSNDDTRAITLINEYKEHMNQIWQESPQESTKSRLQLRSLERLRKSCNRFQYNGGIFDKETHFFNAKYHLYRLPNMLLSHLASYFSISENNILEQIEGIFGEIGISHNPIGLANLKFTVASILSLRLLAYLKKGYRDDHVVIQRNINQEHPSFMTLAEKYFPVKENLLFHIYATLMPLKSTMSIFVDTNDIAILSDASLFDPGPVNEARFQIGLQDYTHAIKLLQPLQGYDSQSLLAQSLYYMDQNQQALTIFQEINTIIDNAFSDDESPPAEYNIVKGINLTWIAGVLIRLDRIDEALTILTDAERFFVMESDTDEFNKDNIARVLVLIGVSFAKKFHLEKAISYFNKAFSMFTDHTDRSFSSLIYNLATAHYEKENYEQALLHIRHYLNIISARHGTEHTEFADGLVIEGSILAKKLNYGEATHKLKHAEKIYTEVYDDNHSLLGVVFYEQARVCFECGDENKALLLLEKSREIDIQASGREHSFYLKTMLLISIIRISLRQHSKAIEALEDAITIDSQHPLESSNSVLVATAAFYLGHSYMIQGHFAEATITFNKAKRLYIAWSDATDNQNHLLLIDILICKARNHINQMEYDVAMNEIMEARGIIMSMYDQAQALEYDVAVATLKKHYQKIATGNFTSSSQSDQSILSLNILDGRTNYHLGRIHSELKEFKKSRRCFRSAKDLLEQTLGAASPSGADVNVLLESLRQFDVMQCDWMDSTHRVAMTYLREGSNFFLQTPQDIKKANRCFKKFIEHAQSDLQLYVPNEVVYQSFENIGIDLNNMTLTKKAHQYHAKLFWDEIGEVEIPAAIEQNKIILMYDPEDVSAHLALARLFHIKAQIKNNQDDPNNHLDSRSLLITAQSHYQEAMRLPSIKTLTLYGHFLWKNRAQFDADNAKEIFQRIVSISASGESDSFVSSEDSSPFSLFLLNSEQIQLYMTERPYLDESLRKLLLTLDVQCDIFIDSKLLAIFLLFQIYIDNRQLSEARNIHAALKINSKTIILLIDNKLTELSFLENELSSSIDIGDISQSQHLDLLLRFNEAKSNLLAQKKLISLLINSTEIKLDEFYFDASSEAQSGRDSPGLFPPPSQEPPSQEGGSSLQLGNT